MAIIKVVCGIIFKEDKLFICRRSSNKSLSGYWEFPGGKVEQDETFEASLKRELREELGMDVNVQNYFDTVIHEYENFTIELIAYRCEFIEASYKLTDHDKYEWIDLNTLLNYNLAPADIPIAEKLVKLHI